MSDAIDEARSRAGRNYQRALEMAEMRPVQLADMLGLKSQSIANWRHRGVSNQYAHLVAEILGTKPEKISLLPEVETVLDKAQSTAREQSHSAQRAAQHAAQPANEGTMMAYMAGPSPDPPPEPPRKPKPSREQLLRLLLDTPLTADDVEMLYRLVERLNYQR